MLDTKIVTIEQALAALGVTETSLTVAEKQQLASEGYLILPGLLTKAKLVELHKAIEDLTKQEKAEAGHREKGTRHIEELASKGAVFTQLFTHPKLLAVGAHVLQRDFTAGAHAREPLTGFGQQGLHADAVGRMPGEPFHGVTAIWTLDDFSEENGATRYVPGSHLWTGKMLKSVGQPLHKHAQQKQLITPAGTLFVFNSHLWHSGMVNQSQQRRRSVITLCYGRERPNIADATMLSKPPGYLTAAAAYVAGYRQ